MLSFEPVNRKKSVAHTFKNQEQNTAEELDMRLLTEVEELERRLKNQLSSVRRQHEYQVMMKSSLSSHH